MSLCCATFWIGASSARYRVILLLLTCARVPTPVFLKERLKGAAGSKDRFGSTAGEVLEIAALVAAAQDSWGKDTVASLQKEQEIHPKVWGKLVSIARSQNLQTLTLEDLPASYTALYALAVMSPEELQTALNEGLLVRKAGDGPLSSRSILDWTKAYRLRGTGIANEIPLTLVLREDLTEERQKDLLEALQQVADQFGVDLLEGKGGVKQAGLKAEHRKVRASEIEEELMREIGPAIARASDEIKNQFGIYRAVDLIEAPRGTFTGFFQNLEGKIEGAFWKHHGRAYCLRIARDFNLTASRAERYQLKKRLENASCKWGDKITNLKQTIKTTIETYMT